MDNERPGDTRTTVLRIVDELAAELHPRRAPPPSSLRTRLDRDLGLDSLAMAELLARLESAFGASMPSSLLGTAETPEDLLRAVGVGVTRATPTPLRTYDQSHTGTEALPVGAGTLLDVLDWHCESHPDQVHIYLLDEDGSHDALTYADLKHGGNAVAQGLMAADLVPGESVALMLPTGREYFEAFLGILLAGGVPVPIYPPGRPSQIEEHLRRHALILSNTRATMLVTVPEARGVARLLRSSVETMRHVTTATELACSDAHESMPRASPDDTALIQYTSGSTGDPKGVVLSHANVLANIRAMGQAAEVTPRDVFVSWLPLYHDMGLIGAWLGSMCLGMPVVIMSPLAFLARPARWLAAIDAYRGTITAAPNFAYELCLRKVSDSELQTLEPFHTADGVERCRARGCQHHGAVRPALCPVRTPPRCPRSRLRTGGGRRGSCLPLPPRPGGAHQVTRSMPSTCAVTGRPFRHSRKVPTRSASWRPANPCPAMRSESSTIRLGNCQTAPRVRSSSWPIGDSWLPAKFKGYSRPVPRQGGSGPETSADAGRWGCVHHRPFEGPHHPGGTKPPP